MIYASIDDSARYHDDIKKGDTYNILPAYTTAGYLPCTGIKQGYYSKQDIFDWLIDRLLPLCNEYPGERNIIVLDNINVHVDPRIIEIIQTKSCLVKHLPPYSPDYNPIELTFNVLKTWMRRHFDTFRQIFHDDFERFLKHAIDVNNCDKFANEHFKHSPAGYIFEDEIKTFERDIKHTTE